MSIPTQTRPKFGTEMGQNRHKIRPLSVWVVALGAVFYPNGRNWTETDKMGRRVGVGLRIPKVFEIWRADAPLKVRIFLWQLARRLLPSNDQIALRHGPSNGQCALCGEPENVDHIFFGCVLAKFIWSGLREFLPVSCNPSKLG